MLLQCTSHWNTTWIVEGFEKRLQQCSIASAADFGTHRKCPRPSSITYLNERGRRAITKLLKKSEPTGAARAHWTQESSKWSSSRLQQFVLSPFILPLSLSLSYLASHFAFLPIIRPQYVGRKIRHWKGMKDVNEGGAGSVGDVCTSGHGTANTLEIA